MNTKSNFIDVEEEGKDASSSDAENNPYLREDEQNPYTQQHPRSSTVHQTVAPA